MLKSKTYDHYLDWWNYWNSKIPQPGLIIGRVTASTIETQRDSKTYRERLQRQLIEIRNLQGERALGEEISLELNLHGGANKVSL